MAFPWRDNLARMGAHWRRGIRARRLLTGDPLAPLVRTANRLDYGSGRLDHDAGRPGHEADRSHELPGHDR